MLENRIGDATRDAHAAHDNRSNIARKSINKRLNITSTMRRTTLATHENRF